MLDLPTYGDLQEGDHFIFASQRMEWAKGSREYPAPVCVKTATGCQARIVTPRAAYKDEKPDEQVPDNLSVIVVSLPW